LTAAILSASTLAAPLRLSDEAALQETRFTRQSGVFYYPRSMEDGDAGAEYHYDDAYFFSSSYDGYNQHLATMSLCLSLAGMASRTVDTYEGTSVNVQRLLEEIGFTDFEVNEWFHVKPTRDSIGASIARKTLVVDGRPYTLLALAVRGSGYESEWASNLTVGESGLHQGFREARDQVLAFVRDYIARQGIAGDLKLWVTGYSRAAATANLVGGAVDDGIVLGGNVLLRPRDLYAYTFETPQGTTRALSSDTARYANIFNIINLSDPVSKVAPSAWDFTWYGETLWLPSRATDPDYSEKLSRMLACYEALGVTTQYVVDDFAMKTIKIDPRALLSSDKPFLSLVTVPGVTQEIFLNDAITKFAKEFLKSRKNYVQKYQEGMRELMAMQNGMEEWGRFQELFEQKLLQNVAPLIASTGVFGLIGMLWAGGTTRQLLEKYATQCLREAGITAYDAADIRRFAISLSAVIADFALSNPMTVANLVSNFSSILQAHVPEICLAWLQSMDSHYTEGAEPMFGNGSYRVVRINSPVDVAVYDEDGHLIASIVSDDPQDVDGGVISAVNEDGEKLVYLPAVADYTVEVVATQEGSLSYSINEYSPEAGEISRLVNFYEIPVGFGTTLTGNVPAYDEEALATEAPEGSPVEYALSHEGEGIAPDDDLSGRAATEAYYSVEVVSANEEQGTVMGQGIRQLGNFAQVEAVAVEGYAFEGWYLADERVSTEAQYRFPVDADVTLEARFAKAETPAEEPAEMPAPDDSTAAEPINQLTIARVDASLAATPLEELIGERPAAPVVTDEISTGVSVIGAAELLRDFNSRPLPDRTGTQEETGTPTGGGNDPAPRDEAPGEAYAEAEAAYERYRASLTKITALGLIAGAPPDVFAPKDSAIPAQGVSNPLQEPWPRA
jgi:hypothetical protein